MQTVLDIFALWPTITEFAEAIDANPDQVRKWKKFRRFPQESWESVAAAANQRGTPLTVEMIIAANAPMKPRGRPPARKVRAKRVRSEARAT